MRTDIRVRALEMLALVTVLASSSPSIAEEPTAPSTPSDDVTQAEKAFRDGVAAYAAGRFETAIHRFADADRIQPRPELVFDIARSYEKLGKDRAALGAYREYLHRAGHPEDEADVTRRIAALESRLGAGGESASAGNVVASDASRPIEVASGAAPDRASEPARAVERDRADRKQGSTGTMTKLGWVGLGASAVAFGGAVVFEVLRKNAESNAAHEPEQIQFSRDVHAMESDRTAARVLFGVGGVLAVAGGVLLVLGMNES